MFSARKAPIEQLDYGFTWSQFLQDGDTLTDSTWTITGADSALTIVDDEFLGEETVIWLVGGTVGVLYTVTNVITTNSTPVNRIPEQSFQLYLVPKR